MIKELTFNTLLAQSLVGFCHSFCSVNEGHTVTGIS